MKKAKSVSYKKLEFLIKKIKDVLKDSLALFIRAWEVILKYWNRGFFGFVGVKEPLGYF